MFVYIILRKDFSSYRASECFNDSNNIIMIEFAFKAWLLNIQIEFLLVIFLHQRLKKNMA